MSYQAISRIGHYDENTILAIFTAVDLVVFSAGGDGDGWIVSKDNFISLANFFETTEIGKHYPTKTMGEGYICFAHEQEGICFVDGRNRLPNYTSDPRLVDYPSGDIVVEIW